jgi:hypothetical protein
MNRWTVAVASPVTIYPFADTQRVALRISREDSLAGTVWLVFPAIQQAMHETYDQAKHQSDRSHKNRGSSLFVGGFHGF